jgi:hypothetical protein
MMKRTVHALVLMLLATPLALVGCGDSGEKNGTGGSGGGAGGTAGATTYDGGGGTGGTKLDVGSAPDLAPPPVDTAPGTPDVALPIDTTLIVDAAIPDVPIVPDVPITIDTVKIDVSAPVDIATPIDTTPVVCTIVPAFTGGAVTANLTLTKACSPYTITDGISVNGNATLTIEAGATLRFDPDVGIWIGYNTAAKLVAVGTAASPITFTSSNTTPSAGDWDGITLWSGTMGGTQIAYANLDYCGSSSSCILGSGVKPARVSIDHVAINHVGAGYNGIEESAVDSNFTISNCTFSNIQIAPTQQYAISVQAPSFAGIDSTNTFNGGAMIELAGGLVSVSTDWKNPGTTIAVTSSLGLGGTTTPILTIAAGSIFKFASDIDFWVGYSDAGNLKVNGTLAAPVVFTSLNTSPAPGDWGGITLWGAGRATITYATISYGGSSYGDIAVENNSNVLDIENSTLSYSGGYAIGIACGSLATLTSTGNTFTANTSGTVGPGPDQTAVACQ